MGLTNEIKSTLLSYYKFYTHCLMVGTEIETNHGIADIIVMTRKTLYIYEIEIKISLSDLKNELKKDKHKFPIESNKYYFCVPTNILKETILLAEQLNPKYGVLEYIPNKNYKGSINIIKQASLLHKNVNNYQYRMMQRINNDLCKCYRMLYPSHE